MSDIAPSLPIKLPPRIQPQLTLLSTFELLVQPIAPKGSALPVLNGVVRTVVQGYFLTIANTSGLDITVRLQFTASATADTITNLIKDTVTIKDVSGVNIFEDVSQLSPNVFIYTVGIPAKGTVLVTFLPDLTNAEVVKTQDLEIRGYVEVGLISPFAPNSVKLLLTPELRGTFLPQDLNAAVLDLDQLAYSLPTANGSSLFVLTGPAKPSKELKLEVKEIEKIQKDKDLEKDQLEKAPESFTLESAATPVAANDLQRVVALMAQRLDEIEQRSAGNGRSFIQPQERPSVGEQVVNKPRN